MRWVIDAMRLQEDTGEWERRLEADGLGVLDSGPGEHTRAAIGRAVTGETPDAWTAWAKHVLRTHRFASPYQRRVWELYADGLTYSQIRKQLNEEGIRGGRVYRKANGTAGRTRTLAVGTSRRAVTLCIDRVRRLVPLSPSPNPWRKSGRTSVALRGRALESLVVKVMERLRRTAASRDELGKLLEVHMSAKEAVKYERIRLNGNLDIPGVAVGKDVLTRELLKDADARPHAGGIDVTLDTRDRNQKPTRTRITIPWWRIKDTHVLVDDGS